MAHHQTVTNWIVRLGDGDENAIETMFSKYFDRLIKLAVRKMHGMNQVPRSGEDIAISAVKSFCTGLKNKQIEVESEDDLWGCLFRITTRKACAERRRTYAVKRGGNVAIFCGDAAQEDDDAIFRTVAGREPSPELALEMAENADELLAVFESQPTQRKIIELKLQGYSNQEIAERTDLVLRTVFWHLKNIQAKWTFIKSMEYLTENLFAGLPAEYLARTLDWPEETVRSLIERMLERWDAESGDSEGVTALRQKFFEPDIFAARLSEQNPLALRVESASGKTADRWMARIRTEWRAELQRMAEQ